MPFIDFETVNAKTLKKKFKKTTKIWYIYSLRFKSLAGTDIKETAKKPRAIKFKIQEKHMT